MNSHLSGFQKLALTAVIATFVMVVIGVIVRATGSGLGCIDWPLCNGNVIPPFGDDKAWIESIHRWWGVLIGFIILGLALAAWRTQRRTRSIMVVVVVAVVLTGIQALLGKWTVESGNSGESVTAHLAVSMLILAALIFVFVRSRYEADLPQHGRSQRLALLIAFTAATVYALMLFGANVTATSAALVFPDWPLMNGQLIPTFSDDPVAASLQMANFAHRIAAVMVGLILLWTTVVVWRESKGNPGHGPDGVAADRLLGLVGTAATLYVIQVVVGAFQIWTTLAAWAVSLHLALGAAIWGLLAAAAYYAWYDARAHQPEAVELAGTLPHDPIASDAAVPQADLRSEPTSRVSWQRKVRAYIALTKPRIIELLLVTTIPAMVLAWRFVDDLDPLHFAWLVVATLIGGGLAAGAANAINCYFDRDIDLLMTRTRRRPLPAHDVASQDALVFGLILTVVSFAWLAFATNLVAAFLALLAIGFYVVIYTILLKRTTSQNIVLGGAAGALPPVIGWAAVTGNIALPALLLFAIVFYWTPPHFWALALRIRGDYEAADVPMLPVTHGVRETTRQIALYSVLMVALTLVFFAVAQMGLVFLAGALVLGGLFLFQAFAMAREGTDARAVRMYRYSITYLTALFALIVLDVAVFVAL
ncbi:MAG: heme o synthase [Chloroflexota bacterium]